jgi:hypothetical protein
MIGMLARVIPFEQRSFLGPLGWSALYSVLTVPGAYLAFATSLGLVEHWPRWVALAFLFAMNGVAWYAITRALIWTVSEIRAAFRAQ